MCRPHGAWGLAMSGKVKWPYKGEINSNTWNWNIALIHPYYKWNIFFCSMTPVTITHQCNTQPGKKAKVQSFCNQWSWLFISPNSRARLPWDEINFKSKAMFNLKLPKSAFISGCCCHADGFVSSLSFECYVIFIDPLFNPACENCVKWCSWNWGNLCIKRSRWPLNQVWKPSIVQSRSQRLNNYSIAILFNIIQ